MSKTTPSLCFNPEHLFLGTVADNNRDKMLKGRAKGISSQRALERCQEGELLRDVNGRFTSG